MKKDMRWQRETIRKNVFYIKGRALAISRTTS
jgi:hypothetical protein